MPSSVAYVYSLSSYDKIVRDAIRSVRSLLSTTDPDPSSVHIYFTPPIEEKHTSLFEHLGVTVHERDPAFPGGFRTRLGSPKAGYAEKWWLTECEADTAVFLDCDTIILGDLKEVIKGDYELKARRIDASDPQRYRQLFMSVDREPQEWYPNTGFLVFKNGLHRQIRNEWRKFIESEIPYYSEGFTKEQYALALATTDRAFEPMTPEEHVMEWLNETTTEGYVHHLADGGNDIRSRVLNSIDARFPIEAKNKIVNRIPSLYDGIV